MTYLYGKAKSINHLTIDTALLRMGKIKGFTRENYKDFKKSHTRFTEAVRQSAYVLARYSFSNPAVMIANNLRGVKITDIIDECLLVSYSEVEHYHIAIALFMLAPQIYNSIFNYNLPDPNKRVLPCFLVNNALPPKHKIMPRTRYLAEQDDIYKESKSFTHELQISFEWQYVLKDQKRSSDYSAAFGEIFDYFRLVKGADAL